MCVITLLKMLAPWESEGLEAVKTCIDVLKES